MDEHRPTLIAGGSIFDDLSATLVVPVNCLGIVRFDDAREFKRRYPSWFADYARRCQFGLVRVGEPFAWTPRDSSGPTIVNFPTKFHWRQRPAIDAIARGMKFLVFDAREMGIRKLAMPALGCGIRQLHWADIGPLMYQALMRLELRGIRTTLHVPSYVSESQRSHEYLASATRESGELFIPRPRLHAAQVAQNPAV